MRFGRGASAGGLTARNVTARASVKNPGCLIDPDSRVVIGDTDVADVLACRTYDTWGKSQRLALELRQDLEINWGVR